VALSWGESQGATGAGGGSLLLGGLCISPLLIFSKKLFLFSCWGGLALLFFNVRGGGLLERGGGLGAWGCLALWDKMKWKNLVPAKLLCFQKGVRWPQISGARAVAGCPHLA